MSSLPVHSTTKINVHVQKEEDSARTERSGKRDTCISVTVESLFIMRATHMARLQLADKQRR